MLNTKTVKLLSVLLSAIIILTAFSGCSGSDADSYIYLNIANKPVSLDPQTAQTDEELMIVRNIFEGLLRKDSKGKICPAVCETYSKNGLTYTFNLKKGLKWSNGENLTSRDFLFAFRRAVTPNVKSPFVNRLFKIKNAKAVYSGKLKASSLGVTAPDDYTLKIKLTSADKNFEDTLTTSLCMPCNEEFFKSCSGKYGLEADSIVSNGSYSLTKWNPDDFGIRIRKNENYKGKYEAKNGAVFISSKTDEKTDTLFKKTSIDVALVNNSDLDIVLKTGVEHISFQNICWVMTVSPEYPEIVRKAFLSAVSYNIFKDKLSTGFSVAHSLYPKVLNPDQKVNGKGILTYDLKKSMSDFSYYISLTDEKEFPVATLYYYDNPGIIPAIRSILGHWQQNLCAFVNITPAKNPEELKNELKNPNQQFAVFPVKATSQNTNEYLLNFGKSGSDYVKIQKELLADYTLVPLAFENTNICYLKNVKNLYCDGENGYIDFSFAEKD